MRLILLDIDERRRMDFWPLSLSRPIWELRCGMTSLADKLVARFKPSSVACFVPPYLADAYRQHTSHKVNDPATLAGDDLLIVDATATAAGLDIDAIGPSEVGVGGDDQVLYARIARADLARMKIESIQSLLESARSLPRGLEAIPTWRWPWELVLANGRQIVADFAVAGRSGIEGSMEQPSTIRGDRNSVYIAPGATVHPMVVIDATNGPVYIDESAEIHPFTRIEGPCYIGPRSMLLGCKCREGTSIGPLCRVGGEVEESIIQGYSNKYHDGFLGHAYVGEWVNLGALTTNSDLRNDYGSVSVRMEGRPEPVDTGSQKVGSLIGDHTRTSIGTLMNTGAYVGAMTLLVASGRLLPKCIPSFCSYVNGRITDYFGRDKLYAASAAAMARRGKHWTPAEQQMWDAAYDLTTPGRKTAMERKID